MNIQTLFSLSKQGKRDLFKTTLLTILHQLSVILPVVLFIMLTDEMLKSLHINSSQTISLWKYVFFKHCFNNRYLCDLLNHL